MKLASLMALAFVLAGCGGGWEGGKRLASRPSSRSRCGPRARTEERFGSGGSTAIWQVERIQRPRRRASNSSVWPVPLRPLPATLSAPRRMAARPWRRLKVCIAERPSTRGSRARTGARLPLGSPCVPVPAKAGVVLGPGLAGSDCLQVRRWRVALRRRGAEWLRQQPGAGRDCRV